MTLRHAAALALAGWYLMVPPPLSYVGKDGPLKPVRSWTAVSVLATEEECEAARSRLSQLDPKLGSYRGLPPEEIYDAQCIASDDPRLKEK